MTLAKEHRGRVAAVDCGTNSTRLLISEPDGSPVLRVMRITRLGEGVDSQGALAEQAIRRTIDVLEDFKKRMDAVGVEAVRATTTSAARDASNREALFQPAEEVLGVPLELLSGEEEAALSFAGATAELTYGAPWLVVDIGGGSTELAVGDESAKSGSGPEGSVSLAAGCVRVTERFLRQDPPTSAQLQEARVHLHSLYEEALRQTPALGKGHTFVGLAGTVSALASFDLGLTEYDRAAVHHHVLEAGAISAMLSQLVQVPAEKRAEAGIEAARADVIIGGALVLSTLMEHLGYNSCLVSEADILDGLVMSLLEKGTV